MNKVVKGLLTYLKKTHQEALLPAIAEELQALARQKKATVTVFSPCSLTVRQKQKATQLARRLTGQSNLQPQFTVEADLIDGLKIQAGDRVWDLSLASQISQLKDKLYETG